MSRQLAQDIAQHVYEAARRSVRYLAEDVEGITSAQVAPGPCDFEVTLTDGTTKTYYVTVRERR